MYRSASKSENRLARSSSKGPPARILRRTASIDTQFRGSYVPETRRSVSEERKSCVGNRWSGPRKSSLNLNDGKHSIKDTRPLHDKAYQRRKLNDLVQFLEESGCAYPVTVAKLMSPSKKDFESIFQFLYNYWEPTYTVSKVEEEAPKILKNFGYPFTVNKSAFMYVARTNWPVLLGVLIWMMDLNKFAVNFDPKSLAESGEQAILNRYIYDCYYSNYDSDEKDVEVFAKIVRSQMPESLEKLQMKNEEKCILLRKMEDEIKELDVLEKEDAEFDDQIKVYDDYFIKMKNHMEKKQDIVQQLAETLKQKQLELNNLQSEIKIKQDAYEAQGFDGKKHVDYLETQKKELCEKLVKKNANLRTLQDMCWEIDIQRTEVVDKRSQVCENFNELYQKVAENGKSALTLAEKINNPMLKKLCEDSHLSFPDIKMSSSEHSRNLDCQENQNILEQMEKNVKNLTNFIKGIASAQNEKLHEVCTENSKLSVELKLLSSQIHELECEIRSLEKEDVEEIASLESQCDELSKSLESFQLECDERQKKCKELKDEFDILRTLKRNKESEFEMYFKKRDRLFLKWKEAVEEIKKFTEECGEEICQKVQKLDKN